MNAYALFPATLLCLFFAAASYGEPYAEQHSTPAHDSFPALRTTDPHWEALIARLASDGLERERLEQLFKEIDRPWSPVFMAGALQEIYGPRLGAGAQLKDAPESDVPPPPGYVPPTESGYAGAQALLKEQSALLADVQTRYGVPPSLIAAILLLESDMGHEPGNALVFYALAGMAGAGSLDESLSGLEHYRASPALRKKMETFVREKSAWAYKELYALIRYGETNGVDILRLPGSVYGAVGLCRFAPSHIEAYGVDSTGKGVVDLFNLSDAAHSMGNFLRAHAFSSKLPIKKQLEVLRRYNQSDSYAELVLGVSLQLAGRPVPSELSAFSAGNRRGYKAWWPKIRAGYRIPLLKTYALQTGSPAAPNPLQR